MKHYWMAYCNDGLEITGKEQTTKMDAIKECKEAFKFDYEECGHAPGIDYYIQEFYESDTEFAYGIKLNVMMTLGKRGAVKYTTQEAAY